MIAIDFLRDRTSLPALAAAIGLALLSSSAAAQPKGEIVVASSLFNQHNDPTVLVSMANHLSGDFIFDGLLNLGPEGKYPALATGWKISEDGKQVDFDLRRGVKFHNGDPFTAEDVKFSYEKILDSASTHSYRKPFVDSIERIEVVDPHKVRMVLKAPWPGFFSSIRYGVQPIVPKAYYEKVGAKGFQEKPVGTGPFKLVEVKAGEWNKYEANAEYWGGAPAVKTVTQRVVKEAFTLYAMVEKGEVDIATGLSGALLDRVASNSKLRIFTSRYSGTSAMYFNKVKFPESRDKNVRLAVGHALNRADIARKLLNGVCEPAASIFTPGTFGYLAGLNQVAYDPAKAKKMLADAGVKPGQEISYTLQTDSFPSLSNAPQVLEALAGNLEAVGFKVVREPYDSTAWLAMMRGRKQPAVFYGPSSMPDDGGETLATWFVRTSMWSAGNIDVPRYNAIFDEQLKAADLKQREKLLQEFARLEDENREVIPLFWCHTAFVAGPRIKEWQPALGSGYNLNLKSVRLAQ
ncbi:MAG: ABC transporter substrate-binding protein [Reyranellaceae bacterium]